ncbi:MAG: 2-oxoglutarate dehydrogenase E2 component (dihydrolipoamide succinyltransferase) [Chitinophagaceae bacterium]|nr:MAG: 2-oxoglutarate dehydrogenase E2 component (dihydrolipoamide succinyltransferase) [Chitinophagaceae bacterium]
MAIAELIMPKLGESIMEATILKWHKNVGDHVKLDETVLDIATDKVDSEVPSTVEGTITEILFNVNDVVPIGTVIARINTVAAAPLQHRRSWLHNQLHNHRLLHLNQWLLQHHHCWLHNQQYQQQHNQQLIFLMYHQPQLLN